LLRNKLKNPFSSSRKGIFGNAKAPYIFSSLVMVIGIFGSSSAWRYARSVENEEMNNLTTQSLEAVQTLVKKAVSERVLSLERMAKRLSVDRRMPRAAWISDSRSYQNHLHGLVNLAIVTAQSGVVWEHSEKHSATSFREIFKSKEIINLIQSQMEAQSSTGPTQIEGIAGQSFFVSATPIKTNGQELRVLVGIHDLGKILSALDFGQNLNFEVFESGKPIFSRVIDESSGSSAKGPLEIGNLNVEIQVSLTSEALSSNHRSLSLIILISSIGICILTGALSFLYVSNKQKTVDVNDMDQWQQAILNSANYTVVATDVTGIIRVFNATAERLLGYSAEELLGKSSPAIFHKAEEVIDRANQLTRELGFVVEPGFEAFVAKANVTGLADENEWTYLRKDGIGFPVRLSVTALRNSFGELSGYLGIGYDLTVENRRQLQIEQYLEEIAAYKKALDLSYIVARTDEKGRITDVNDNLCAISGYSRAELIGRDHRMLSSGFHDKEFFKEMWQSIQAGKPWRGQIRNKKKTGEVYWVDTSISPIFNFKGELKEFLAIRNDITRSMTQNEELIVATERALESSKAKSEFLANMSHEIRTPMNGVIGLTDLLLKTKLDPKQRDLTSTIKSSGQILMAIINDILDFSKIEAGKLEIETMNISLWELMKTQVEMMRPKANEKLVSISLSVDPKIPWLLRGDAGRIGQVLANLVGNAIKFTSKGQIVVRAVALATSSEKVMVKLSVEDTGIGLTDDQQAKLFQPFQQADSSTSRKYGGTGLGLSICKRLVEMMGGTIGVQSRIGEGSCFWLELPFEIAQVEEPLQASSEGFFDGVKSLVVASDSEKFKNLHENLLSLGIRAKTSKDCRQALEMLRRKDAVREKYDLVFVDEAVVDPSISEFVSFVLSDPSLLSIRIVRIASTSNSKDFSSSERVVTLGESFQKYELVNIIRMLSKSAQKSQTQTKTIKVESSGRLILLVEDNLVNQMVAMNQLESLGYSCHSVANGREALEALSRVDYSLILMDCQMPEMDGFEATRQIRQLPGLVSRVPIVALTANAMGGDREKCLAAGMNDYLTKPIELERLGEIMREYLPRKNAA
jgi:two-component system, sensor histidine kinase and response regulator